MTTSKEKITLQHTLFGIFVYKNEEYVKTTITIN